MRRNQFILALCVLALGFSAHTLIATAQSDETEWPIPDIECDQNCYRDIRLGADGLLYMYILDATGSRMYVVEQGTSQPLEYDMLQIYRTRTTFRDFLPISPEAVIFFDKDVGGGVSPMALVNLNTEQVTPLFLGLEGHIPAACDPFPLLSLDWRAFYTIGADQILLCSFRNGTGFAHLAHLLDEALVIDETIEIGPGIRRNRLTLPWFRMVGGRDGNVYLEPMSENVVQQTLNIGFPTVENGERFILRYDPNASSWSSVLVRLPEERMAQLPSDIAHTTTILTYQSGVDENGNLYLTYLSSIREGDTVNVGADLVKYDLAGNEIWHINEQDYNGERFWLPVLVGEDELIMHFRYRETNQFETYRFD